MIPPHGGELVNRVAPEAEAEELRERAARLKKVQLSARELSDLEMIAVGAFSPLTGFMGPDDYESVVERMRLTCGLVWSLPITLSASTETASSIRVGDEVALCTSDGRAVGLLNLEEKYRYDREREARQVFRTTDEAHPGVASLYRQGEVLLGGPVKLIDYPGHGPFEEYVLFPGELRKLIEEKGWVTVVGFQTRNPVHRAHEYIQKCALEVVDGLLLHPIVGETKEDDIPAEVRMRCYQVLLDNYYPKDRVVLSALPVAMRYAGPREAIFHAIVRKNFGCTHFIVGRDHAGVGNYYGTYDAQRIFLEFTPEELGIVPLFFEHTFYCRRCVGMASTKTCPHDGSDRVILSGTKVRGMLSAGKILPEEFTRPEVAAILMEAFAFKYSDPAF